MDPLAVGVAGVIVLLALLIVRVPIAIALATVGLVGLLVLSAFRPGFDVNIGAGINAAFRQMGSRPQAVVANFQLVTIPMFLLMGYFAFASGFTRDIYKAGRLWLAGVPGGLAAASTIGCAAFAAISGSSVATAAAMGKIAVPEMLRYRYDKGLATAVVAASGTLGSLIPPSTLMILYAVFTETSIAKLFIAGIVPGILSAGLYIAMIVVRARLKPDLAPPVPRPGWGERFASLKGTWGILALFIFVMVGIFSGIVTPTEAGAIGAAGALILGVASRRLDRDAIERGLYDTVRQAAVIFVIIIGAFLMITFVGRSGLARELTGVIVALDVAPIVIVLGLSVVYVLLGTFMGPLEIMLLTVPIVAPVIEQLGFDLIWFGIIMIKYLEIGLITPPVGLTVYIIKGVVGREVELHTIFRGVLWFLAMDIVTLLILIFWPQVTLFLPGLMS
jgi:tripartite ATP-independent transporter DctM subunit